MGSTDDMALKQDCNLKKSPYLPTALVILSLVILTVAIYWQVVDYDFIDFDDNNYVTENQHIKSGFSKENIRWAFQFSNNETYWHPLTWLSHMADCHFYGLDASGHHITNLQIHMLNVILLFLFLKKTTSKQWPSAFVAGIFALHPINVDSVAWIAERKNLLSSFFWLATLWIYSYYTEKPNLIRYLCVLGSFTLGLMAKSMLVTLPFLLLLLDYWPLDRLGLGLKNSSLDSQSLGSSSIKNRFVVVSNLVVEKLPLMMISGFSVLISIISIEGYDPTVSFESIPMPLRVKNALVSYHIYIQKMLYPSNLAVFYPYPEFVSTFLWMGALLMLVTISFGVLFYVKRWPYLFVGWFWYVGTLVPVIGLFQQGLWPAYADRWVYIPFIGLFIMVSWGIADLTTRWRHQHIFLFAIGIGVLSFAGTLSCIQTRHWRNNVTLFKHTAEVTINNYLFHNNLGKEFHDQGNTPLAIVHFSKALEISPSYAHAMNNLGMIEWEEGNIDVALNYFLQALEIHPDNAEAYNNLGLMHMDRGNLCRAREYFVRSLINNPKLAKGHYNLAIALQNQNNFPRALTHYEEALSISPEDPEIHNNLGNLLARRRKFKAAIKHLDKALKYKPDYAEAHNNLGSVYTMMGVKSKAIFHYNQAIRLNPNLQEAKINLRRIMFEKETNSENHQIEH